MAIQAYLFFEGRCEEAVTFYQETLAAELLVLVRYKDSPEPPPPGLVPEGSDERIMHASLRIGEAILMASDGSCAGQPDFSGFALTLSVKTVAEAEVRFHGLGQGGQVIMPLGRTFFSPCFGMLTDRFGLTWMVSTEG